MSLEQVQAWERHSRSTGAVYQVGKELALCAQRGTAIAWPSNRKLARATRLSERQVQRALRALEQAGEIVRQPSEPGRRRVYLIGPSLGDTAMSPSPPQGGRHTVTPKATPTRARVRTAGKRINDTPPSPPDKSGGDTPDLLGQLSNGNHPKVTARLAPTPRGRRRRRDQQPEAPECGPCPVAGCQPADLAEEWARLSERLRAVAGENVCEAWFAGAHLHQAGDRLELGITPAKLGWVYGRYRRLLETVVDRPLELVACQSASAGPASGSEDPRLGQRREALRRANDVRYQLARARREVRQLEYQPGKERIAQLLLEQPAWLERQPVHLVLQWPTRIQERTWRGLLADADIRGVRSCAQLTDRQRQVLAQGLRLSARARRRKAAEEGS